MWKKTSEWGNYSDVSQSHKEGNLRHVSIVRQAKALGCVGKHAGSKPISKLLANIRIVEMDNSKKNSKNS